MIQIEYVSAPGSADSDYVLLSPALKGGAQAKKKRGKKKPMAAAVVQSFGSNASHSANQHRLVFQILTDEGDHATTASNNDSFNCF